MNNVRRILVIIVLTLGMLVCHIKGILAQNVRLEGKTFVQQSTSGDSTRTEYYFQDRNGVSYPIYLSSRGKAYAWVKSKKSGKLYKRYLPKVTEKLNQKKK